MVLALERCRGTPATLDLIRVLKAQRRAGQLLPAVLFEVVGSSVEFDDIDGMTLLGVRRLRAHALLSALKRAFDLVGAGLALFACSPVLALIALAVKLDSRGPVFFRQERIGRGGRAFRCSSSAR